MKVRILSYTEDPLITGGVAARCCTSEEIPLSGLYDEYEEDMKNSKALKHAMDSGHHSVAEHITFTFAIEGISRACSHQLVRHRMASYSQQSQRYVKMDKLECVIPHSIEDHPNFRKDVWEKHLERILYLYKELINAGIPPEDARYILPNACTTNLVMTVNLRELIHIAELRLCQRAQWEIRELVEKMVACVVELDEGYAQWLVPQCQRLGYCPEKRGCGRFPPKVY